LGCHLRVLGVLGFRINSRYISPAIMIVLVTSNICWVYVYRELSNDKMNTLGEVLIQTRGFLDEPINILNLTLRKGRIDFELWDVMFRDLIQLSRQFKLIILLDVTHEQQWSQIKTATDSLVDFVQDLTQTYTRNYAHMNITYEHSMYLSRIRDSLLMQLKAIPSHIVTGSNPQVNIADREITEAMDASKRLEVDLKSARTAFNLPQDETSR